MKYAKYFSAIILFVCIAASAYAQDITGTVTDTENNPMPGASVYWADTNVGTAASIDGKFRLHRVKGYDTLVASFLGYENDTLHVDDTVSQVQLKLRQGVALETVVVEGNLGGNYIRHDGILKGETISFAGLCKMACCNLAESFENSASVTVGYSDAISGARQIKMLGLAGTYTQILDENRAIMRGLSAPYGLSYTPGMWLNSIQVSKGISSVTAGHEAITGQINLEHRKPTDDERLFLNVYFDSELKPEVNLSSAIPVTKDKRLSTVILAHGSMDTKSYDHNGDGFRDLPLSRQFDIANRWLYQADNGMQVRWGVKYINDYRLGGQMDYRKKMRQEMIDWANKQPIGSPLVGGIYGSEVKNEEVNAYFKLGMPVGKSVFDKDEQDEMRSNFAMVIDFDHFNEDAYFGAFNDYGGRQNMINANAMYVHYFTYRSSLISGISASSRWVDENLMQNLGIMQNWGGSIILNNKVLDSKRLEPEIGAYMEYTYSIKDKLSVVAGLRYDYNFYFRKNMITPRAHVKWNITPTTVFRASAGLGYRPTDVITDNIGILATGHQIYGVPRHYRDLNRMETALTAGGSLTQTISTINHNDMTISFDYFRTQLFHSVIVDQEYIYGATFIYDTNKKSFTNSYQVDLTWTPIERFDIFATFRYTDSKYTVNREGGGYELVERPLVNRFKTLLNLQYATRMRKWTFDVTAQLNGRSRIPQTELDIPSAYSPVYPMFYAQVSRRIKHWDIYIGCENIGNYTQKHPILHADNPYSWYFNSSLVWGPLMGRKFYIGVRFNLY
ncbi:MAG: TonB-dependent receptor [Alistipes sp.]|nr:TonB-dependent receptor [Alistipes sp.]